MNKRNDYAGLKRKLFTRMLLIAAVSIALVLAARKLGSGRFAGPIIMAISNFFKIDTGSAEHVYFYGIRNYLEILLAIGAIALFLILFRAFLNYFTKYLDEISNAVEALTNKPSHEISLSPELAAIELRLKALQQQTERQELMAKQAQQRKNDLVIYSAHDIKTPLASALGYLILLDGKPDMAAEERSRYTRIALDKTRELESMINELFEMTRYNLNEIELDKTQVNLFDILSEIKEEHYPQLKVSGKQAELNMDKHIRICGDGDKLARVFNNIFKNALMYSEPDSRIDISAEVSEGNAEIIFENRCPPIPEAKLNRLFDQFFRGRETQNASLSGSGLGLAIAKEIVLLHGGSIRAENTETGIRFIVSLPVSDVQSIKEN